MYTLHHIIMHVFEIQDSETQNQNPKPNNLKARCGSISRSREAFLAAMQTGSTLGHTYTNILSLNLVNHSLKLIIVSPSTSYHIRPATHTRIIALP
jgi:hypothetical protein